MLCPSCQNENPAGQKFCGECGAKLAAVEVREERKVITALFCDLVGSTALGERMDHEDVAHLLLDYQQLCRHQIETHGGVVEKFIGDAVVGVFGVPAAHEDDPERAVRAALRIVDDLEASDLPIEVRIGVNTGEALVRLGTGPAEGFATGDTMNTTARLEAAAPVMGVAVGEASYTATAHAIRYDELEPIVAKGKAQPLKAWRALEAVARAGSTERDRTPFVGRELELSMLIQLFERSRTRSATEFVTIVADPGLGKSRLVRELARHGDALEELIIWREGRCPPYGDGISFWALGEIVKAQAGILGTDDQVTIGSKLEAAVVADDPMTRTWIKDRLAPLVGLETQTAPPEREEAFTAWRRFLESLTTTGPAVLVIEDLHWADDAFVSFLEDLSERTAGVPLFILVTARPEIEERHPSWPPGRRSTVLTLSPLEEAELEDLIASTLPRVAPDVATLVAQRAGGSPLFAEQLAAILREDAMVIAGGSIADAPIPTSVQALISARIDGLPPEPKRVLMEASVVGKTFWSGAVEAEGNHQNLLASLAELARREFVRSVVPSAMEGEREYSFWHALVRDVAYAELTKAERARLHWLTALWIAGRTEEALGEQAEIVLYHLDTAISLSDPPPGSEVLLNRALSDAASEAMRTNLSRAKTLLRRAVDALPPTDARRPTLAHNLGRALASQGDYPAAIALLEGMLGDPSLTDSQQDLAVIIATDLADYTYHSTGDRHGNDRLDEMRARVGSGTAAEARLIAREAAMAYTLHDYQRGVELAQASIQVSSHLKASPLARARAALALCQVGMRDPDAPAACRSAAQALMREGDVREAIATLFELANTTMEMGEPLAAIGIFDEASELAATVGAQMESWSVRAGKILLMARLGYYDDVVADAPAIIEWAESGTDLFTGTIAMQALAIVGRDRDGCEVDVDLLAQRLRKAYPPGLLDCALLAAELGYPDKARGLLLECLDDLEASHAFDVSSFAVAYGEPELAAGILNAERRDDWDAASQLAAAAVLAEYREERVESRALFEAAAQKYGDLHLRPDKARVLEHLGGKRSQEASALWLEMGATRRIASD